MERVTKHGLNDGHQNRRYSYKTSSSFYGNQQKTCKAAIVRVK